MSPDRPQRPSGIAPRDERPLDGLEHLTHNALDAAVCLQNMRGVPDVGRKSAHLSRAALDLELALLSGKGKEETDRLCLEIAAVALRILEQGDDRSRNP